MENKSIGYIEFKDGHREDIINYSLIDDNTMEVRTQKELYRYEEYNVLKNLDRYHILPTKEYYFYKMSDNMWKLVSNVDSINIYKDDALTKPYS